MDKMFERLSEERKELQAKGYYPEWVTTQGHQMFKQSYKYEDTYMLGRHKTIAKELSQYLPTEELREHYEEVFFELLWSGKLSPSTPVLANCGTDRGFTVACSGQYIGDSVESFYTELKETALLSQAGFGTSGHFSDIRPRGSSISKGGTASGVRPVIDDFFTCASKISQGGARRGSFAAYLDIESDDFFECIQDLFVNTNGKNYGWIIKQSFIDKLVSGDTEANKRFTEALYNKQIHGKGYYFFLDKVNEHRPQMYKDHGLDVKASNLCVHGDTTILTDQGNLVIKDLENQNVNVWNGKQWSNTQVIKTNTNQELIKVTLNTGESIKCTPYHKFYVQESYSSKPVEKRASELSINDKLIKFNVEAIQGHSKSLDKAYQNGFFTGDGCSYKGKSIVYLYNDKKSLRHKFTDITHESSYKERITLHVNGLQDKFFIPNSDYSIKDRLNWLAGLMDADGTVVTNGTNESLQLASINPEFLRDLQQMLLTLGVRSKVTLNKKAHKSSMPKNDGTGDYALYDCKQIERLLISSSSLYKLAQLGFRCERLQFTANKPQRNAEQFSRVESIEMVEGLHDTYCFNEPLEHKGVFNGILTGNCSEIMLHSSEEYTYSCILSSLNLTKWDDMENDNSIFDATVFLDCVTSDFIAKSKDVAGLEKVRAFTIKGRAIGLGVMGLHTLMQSRSLPIDSLQSHLLDMSIFKRIHAESLRASEWLARVLGEPDWCKGYGVRNTHRTALAPTKSTALLMGGVSEGINPDPGMAFEMASAVGELKRITPVFYELMKERGMYNKKTVNRIIANLGSVQQEDWLTDHEKQVFKTAFEINQEVLINRTSARQQFICQGQSLNLFVADEDMDAQVAYLISLIFLDPNILSQYYIYSRNGVVVNDECVMCSG